MNFASTDLVLTLNCTILLTCTLDDVFGSVQIESTYYSDFEEKILQDLHEILRIFEILREYSMIYVNK